MQNRQDEFDLASRRQDKAVLLLARSAFAAAPHGEMKRLAALAARAPGVTLAVACFSEQGTPSLREAILQMREARPGSILIVPLVLPMEPGFRNWLTRSLRRWQAEEPTAWPPIHVAGDIARHPAFEAALTGLIEAAAAQVPLPAAERPDREGSLVPPQKRRVLVCQGGACNAAGAAVIWGHLRNVQERRKLRVTGEGTMTAKATCLGPCNLAPVLQVFPEGTYYGGVNEAAIDRIADEHLLGGSVVEDFAYHPTGRRQWLRRSTASPDTSDRQETNRCVT